MASTDDVEFASTNDVEHVSTNDVGLAPDRVQNQPGPDLTDLCCLICHNILWKPVTCERCEGYFCSACIENWLAEGRTDCPSGCEQYMKRACPRFVNTILSKLQMGCIYESNGCREILPYEAIKKHETQCGYHLASTNNVGLAPDRVRNLSGPDLEDVCCLICRGILWKPVTCERCEAYFCSACIKKWLTQGRTDCPLGREQYMKRACPRFVNTILSKLQMGCIYESNGCREILPYEAIKKHETQCGYQPQQCPDCLSSLLKKNIEQHISRCELTCADCKIVYKRCDASQSHTDIICVTEQFRRYRCQSEETIKQLREDLKTLRERQQFVTPNNYTELDCGGRLCIKCGKCRDWYFTGNAQTWQWLRSRENSWTRDDNMNWRIGPHGVKGCFTRRDGATCTHLNVDLVDGIVDPRFHLPHPNLHDRGVVLAGVNRALFDGCFHFRFRLILGPICLCEDNTGA
ncbi:unnamed protein product [Adineta steineri]|uniref:Uncharacterized protein n=1 Tax=Adineta steineri TaxID=433720 RepID=A0A813ZQ48_9BILA|nr:unnamed protein product [Adineta steineri]CAF3631066.1 unnamed protein product [Adineta steineri]